MSLVVLSGDDILDLLAAVADRLEESHSAERATVVVVGGSFMALHGLRAGTADIDTITRIDDRLRVVVEEVAVERDLRPDWLNDRSAALRLLVSTSRAVPRCSSAGPSSSWDRRPTSCS